MNDQKKSWVKWGLDVTGGAAGDSATKKVGSGTAVGSAVYGILTGDYVGGGLGVLAGLGLRNHEHFDKAVKRLHAAAKALVTDQD